MNTRQCFCVNRYPNMNMVHPYLSATPIQQISNAVITAGSDKVIYTNQPLYGYKWTIHGATPSGDGYCGQLSQSVSIGFDNQIYWCMSVSNNAITMIQPNPSKKSNYSPVLQPADILSNIALQSTSFQNSWQQAANIILSSFAQAVSNLYGYTINGVSYFGQF